MGITLVFLYSMIVLLPLGMTVSAIPFTDKPFLYEAGRGAALTAFMIVMLQPLLAGRFKWIERVFGLDILVRFHRNVAVIAAGLLIAHPLLLASGEHGFEVLISLNAPWPVYLGRVALLLLLLNLFFSLYLLPKGMKFERWRLLHDSIGPAIILLVFFHSFFQGEDLKKSVVLQGLWLGMFVISGMAFAYHRFIRPRLLSRYPYRVTEVKQETDDVWTIKLTPPEGHSLYSYRPGQFHFLTFSRSDDLPVEEHHWTISSSPSEEGFVTSTIKELGDFTSTIGKTKPGDKALVHGPFGRFSYEFYPEEKDLVFIAGGIGITPLRSMLKYLQDKASTRKVLLLYANSRRDDIVYYDELREIEKGRYPRLKVVHVLQNPPEDWPGETGRIDDDMLRKYLHKVSSETGYYLCGPPGLISTSQKILKSLGVKDSRIHMEIFSFLS